MSESSTIQGENPSWTSLQGQYLAFIHAYSLLHRIPPAEMDFQRFFGVTGPTVHRMLVALERRGLIHRVPRQPRSITLRVRTDDLPPLTQPQTVRIPVTRY